MVKRITNSRSLFPAAEFPAKMIINSKVKAAIFFMSFIVIIFGARLLVLYADVVS
jgi:hypothetical protein